VSLTLLALLAVIQGLTEFLPISSSAHLILPSQLGLIEDQGTTIDVAVHLGSLFAVMLYFRSETARLVVGGVDTLRLRWSPESKLFLFLAAASVPTVAAGAWIALADYEDLLRSAELIGWTSILFGLVLWEADRIGLRLKSMADLTWAGALWIGAAQVLSLLPGTSRSGITITMGRFLGYERSEAARFSMLLAIPTILAIGGYKTLEVIASGDTLLQEAALIAMALSFAAAYASIWVFMKLVDRVGLGPFVIYRVVLGIALLAYVYGAFG